MTEREKAILEFKEKVLEYSGYHYVDCDGYGCEPELIFDPDWLDDIVEELLEKK